MIYNLSPYPDSEVFALVHAAALDVDIDGTSQQIDIDDVRVVVGMLGTAWEPETGADGMTSTDSDGVRRVEIGLRPAYGKGTHDESWEMSVYVTAAHEFTHLWERRFAVENLKTVAEAEYWRDTEYIFDNPDDPERYCTKRAMQAGVVAAARWNDMTLSEREELLGRRPPGGGFWN